MFKKIFRSISNKIVDGIARLSPESNSQFFFISLLAIVAIISIGFFPLFGINGLFIKNLIVPIFAGILLIIIAVQSLKNGYFSLPDKKTSWVLFGFLLVTLVSSMFASAPRNALFGTLGEAPSFALLFSLVIIFYVASVAIKKFSHILGILLVMAGVYVVTFLHVILRVIFGPAFLSFGFFNTLTSSLVGSWTDFALFSLLIVILSVICLEMGKFVKTAKWAALTVGIFGIIGLFLSNISWVWILAGAILIIVSIYIFSLAYWNPEKASYEKGRPAPWYSLATFIVILVGFLFGGVITSPLSKVRPMNYNEIYPNITATATAGVVSLRENPITGSGLNSFSHLWNKVKPVALSGTDSGSVEFSTGYSFITTVLSTTGILGIIAWLLLLVLLVGQYIKLFKNGFQDSSERFTGMLIITGSLLLSFIAFIDYPGISLLVLWMIFLGGLWSINYSDEESRRIYFVHDPRTSFFGILSILVLIFVGGAFIYITVRQTASVFAYSSGLRSFSSNNRSVGIDQLSRANQLWATDFYNRTLANQVLLEVQSIKPDQNTSKDVLSREIQRVLSVAMSYADISTKLDPKNYQNWLASGNVYKFFTELKVDGAADRAREAYNKAKALSPNDRTFDLLFANLSVSEGNTDAAKALVTQSIKDFPTVDAYLWLYQQDIQAKNYSDAEIQLVNALKINGNNAGLLTELATLYFVQGKYTDAVALFERSLSINRNQPIAFAYLGVSYEALGKTDQSTQVFNFLKQQIPASADKLIEQVRAQKGGSVTPAVETPEAAKVTPEVSAKNTPVAKPKQ